jgi:multiple sugar transport system ATP-binding protein
MGRAIVRDPQVFLFDEPLSNLDAKLRVQMRAEIKRLQHRLQTTTLYVTHDQVEAMTMGHRIAVLKDGKLQQVGTPLEVYERPANVFVAQFIGAPPMNFTTGAIDGGGDRVVAGAFELPVPSAWRDAAGAAKGRKVAVGIRPEHVLAGGREPRGESARLEPQVDIVETLGDELVVHGRIGDGVLVWKQDPHRPPAIGDRVSVQIELSGLHLFDSETEERLGSTPGAGGTP